MKRHFCRLSYLWILLATPLVAGTSRIYVMNVSSNSIDVIDPATNKIVQTFEGLPRPQFVVFSPDGSRAYLTSETAESNLYVIDTKTGKIINKVLLSGRPNLPAITKDGSRILVCIHDLPGGLDIVDTKSLERVKTIPTKSGLHDVYLTADGKYAIAGSHEGHFLTVFDLQSEQIAWEIQYDQGVQTMVVESGPDGSCSRIFVNLDKTDGFAVVDFAKHKEVDRIELPKGPGWHSGHLHGIEGHSHGIAIAPDGKTLWVDSKPGNAVFVYSLPELKLLGDVSFPEVNEPGKDPIVSAPHWITFTPDSKTAYVAGVWDRKRPGSVFAIDVETRKIVATIPVGFDPGRITTLVSP